MTNGQSGWQKWIERCFKWKKIESKAFMQNISRGNAKIYACHCTSSQFISSVQFSADCSFLVDLSISRMSNNVAPIWHKIQVMLVRPQTKPSHAHAHIHPNDEITYANCFEKWRKQIKLIKYCIGFVLFPLVLCHKYSFFPYISYSLEFIRFD